MPHAITSNGAFFMDNRKEYYAWVNMKTRCVNKNYEMYHRYGGRGISFCDSWKAFDNFYSDMGKAPSLSHTLERLDTDASYCKENCVWADIKAQANNRSNNRRIEYNGQTKTMAQWAECLGVDYFMLQMRLDRGWSVEDAFNIPANFPRYIFKTPSGHFYSIKDVANFYGIKEKTASARFCSKTYLSWSKRRFCSADVECYNKSPTANLNG